MQIARKADVPVTLVDPLPIIPPLLPPLIPLPPRAPPTRFFRGTSKNDATIFDLRFSIAFDEAPAQTDAAQNQKREISFSDVIVIEALTQKIVRRMTTTVAYGKCCCPPDDSRLIHFFAKGVVFGFVVFAPAGFKAKCFLGIYARACRASP